MHTLTLSDEELEVLQTLVARGIDDRHESPEPEEDEPAGFVDALFSIYGKLGEEDGNGATAQPQ